MMNPSLKYRRAALDDVLVILLLVPLAGLLAAIAVSSLQWRMLHDTPLLHYTAYLLDHHGRALYREVFANNLPGTFLFHLAVGKLFGYGDSAIRIADITWLAALLISTWILMRRFGRRVAGAACIIFGLAYFQFGPIMSLQRDYLTLLPLSLAVSLTLAPGRMGPGTRALLAGLLFGVTATIKPPFLIGLPVILFYLAREPKEGGSTAGERRRRAGRLVLAGAAGCGLPIALCVIWLWRQGSLSHFWEMFTTYLPLHVSMDGKHRTVSGLKKLEYLRISFLRLGGHSRWLISAALGTFVALFAAGVRGREKRPVALLVSLSIAYAVYPVLSGQFWNYHWMPFLYLVILLASLCLIRLPRQGTTVGQRLFPVAVLAITLSLAFHLPRDFVRQLKGLGPAPPKEGRVDEIAAFLTSHLKPGDTVQPLDWTEGGVLQAMLATEAEAATAFIHDYHFYHHASHPYIRRLRRQFIDELETSRPRFIIDATVKKPRVSGVDSTATFDELDDLIAAHYAVSKRADGYVIYERRR